MAIEAHFKIVGPSGLIKDIDILDSGITGFPRSEVCGVSYSSYFPLTPYLKSGVAKHWGHPAYGSGAYYVKRNDGRTLVISPIVFADYNIGQSHFSGLEHWNIEFFRYFQGEEKPEMVKRIVPEGSKYDVHQIKRTRWLEIIASGTGVSAKNQIEWV